VPTASAPGWRRANQRARPVISHDRQIGTGIIDRSANMELKSGSLASLLPTRAARRQQLISELRFFRYFGYHRHVGYFPTIGE